MINDFTVRHERNTTILFLKQISLYFIINGDEKKPQMFR